MTPEQRDHIHELIIECRKTTRAAHDPYITEAERKEAYAADDAAMSAVLDALKAATFAPVA